MKLSLSEPAAQDIGDVHDVEVFRREVAEWEPRDLTVRCYWSWSVKAKGFAAFIPSRTRGEHPLVETYRHRTAEGAVRSARARLVERERRVA